MRRPSLVHIYEATGDQQYLEYPLSRDPRELRRKTQTENLVGDIDTVLKEQGVVSERLAEYLKLFLNSDCLGRAAEYHQVECERVLGIDAQNRDPQYTLTADSDNKNNLELKMTTTYKTFQIDGKIYTAEDIRAETILRIEGTEPISVSVKKSKMHIYDEDLRKKYLLNRLHKEGGVFDKLLHEQSIDANDKLVVNNFLDSLHWSQTLNADEIFWQAWNDQGFFSRLFTLNQRSNNKDADLSLIRKFCEHSEFEQRLTVLENRYRSSKKDLFETMSILAELKQNLDYIQKKQWNQVVERLNHPNYRVQMLLALSSMKDINSIEEALSCQGILYALDANTLTQLALRDKSIARRVLRQSIWQRLWIGFLKFFGLKVYWDLPMARFQRVHLRQIVQKFALSLNRFFRKISDSLGLTAEERNQLPSIDFKKDRDSLSSDPSSAARQEEYSYQYFCRIILSYDKKEKKWVLNPKKLPQLQGEITALWSCNQSSAERDGAEAIAKRAMIRVIRNYNVPVIFKEAPHSFYREIFDDRDVLKNFIKDINSIRAFKSLENEALRDELRQKFRERVLQYFRVCQQQSPQSKDFTLVHVDVVNALFNMKKDELYKYPDICFEVVNNILFHYDNLCLMDGFLFKSPESDFVRNLLQHATPMQWFKFVVSNEKVQKKITKKLKKCENKIEKEILLNLGRFFNLAVGIVMEKENRQLIISDTLLPVLYDFQGKVFAPDQADIQEALKSLKAKEPNEAMFQQLIDKSNAESFYIHFSYLLKNIRKFPKWLFDQVILNAELKLDDAQLREIMHYRVFRSDFLQQLENIYDHRAFNVRVLLLEAPELLLRLLRSQQAKINHQDSANRMARIIQKEIHWHKQTAAKKYSPIIIHLVSSQNLDYIVKHADAASLVTLLEALRPLSEQTTELMPLEKKISRALIKAYRNSKRITDRFKDVDLLNKAVLSRASDAELVEIVMGDPRFFTTIFNTPALCDRYLRLSIPGALELMALYNESKLPLSTLLSHFYKSTPSFVLMKLLPIIIAKVRDQNSQRSEVYQYLQSSEFAIQARRASSSDLFNFFVKAKDPQALRLVFFKHPSLADELMRKCWLGLSERVLLEMLSHRIEPWNPVQNNKPEKGKVLPEWLKPNDYEFSAEMISSLVKYIHFKEVLSRLLLLAENKALFKAIMDRITLTQLNEMMAADSKLAEMIVAHFRDQNYRKNFIAVLKRTDQSKDISALKQLQSLFRSQPAILGLFCDYVHQDYTDRKSTESFDSAIIAQLHDNEDHQSVFDILKLCYAKVGGQFYQNFSVPLSSSKTRIFMLYQFCGGLTMSKLYNKHIRMLRDVWRKILKAKNQNGVVEQDYLEQLEDPRFAGEFLSLNRLLSPEYTESKLGGSSRAENVLNTLYAFSRLIKEEYIKFLKESHSTAKRVKSSVLYIKLFRALIETESKWLWLIDAHCTPLQLAQLADADRHLAQNCTPMRNFIFKDFPILCLGKIQRDAEAFKVFSKSEAFKQNLATNPLLNSVARSLGFFSRRPGLVRQRPQDLSLVYQGELKQKAIKQSF